LRFPAPLTPADFLAGYWQKAPLFIPAGSEVREPTLSPDELAWLATLPDVESRLIYTHDNDTTCSYSVEHGPFDDATLMKLPDSNWTLLVQDVEKHLPDFRALFEQVPFIPDWRIDDLMVSFAAPGGSVGPHRDHYDVFLCQGEGRRQWRLTTADKVEASADSAELSLLQPFAAEQEYMAEDRDVLYLPPGVPHWGIAQDRCVTYSIGMRAPLLSEFITAFERLFPGRRRAPVTPQDLKVFYQDPDLSLDEAVPGLISERALQRAQACFRLAGCSGPDELATTFGSLVTDPKAWLAPDRMSIKAARKVLTDMQRRNTLSFHGMARVAYTAGGSRTGGVTHVFANGFHREIDPALAGPVAELCRQRRLQYMDFEHWQTETRLHDLLAWLLGCGVFDPGDE
jgi:50S ribosomal protein L16 3-hydroxylase